MGDGATFENKELGVVIRLPIITGNHYARYWQARIEHAAVADENGFTNPGDLLAEQIAGLVAIAEEATVDGHELTMGSALKALRWAAVRVDEYLGELRTVPKASSTPPSTPPVDVE